MTPDLGLLIQILRDLAVREVSWNAENDLDENLSAIYRYLELHSFRRCNEEEIENVLRTASAAGELHAWGGFLFLRPCQTREWAVPVLTVTYKSEEPASLALRLGLFLVSAEGAVVSLGYRFESPDLTGAEHDFFHMQHIVELGNGSFALPTPPWVPQTKLAVPLDVSTNVGLLLCLLASLYGPRSEVLGQITSAQYSYMLAPHLREIRWAAA